MKKLVSLLLVLLIITMAGCATLRGMAEDTENLAKGLRKETSKK